MSDGSKPQGLIESLAYQGGCFPLMRFHLDRLKASCQALNIPYHLNMLNVLKHYATTLDNSKHHKVRLELFKNGEYLIESSIIEHNSYKPVITLAEETVHSQDVTLQHKHNQRQFFDETQALYAKEGFHDVLYFNEKHHITQASRYNLFIQKAGSILTPPLKDGLLGGVMRQYLLSHFPFIQESHMTYQDLKEADKVFISNAVRGIKEVTIEV